MINKTYKMKIKPITRFHIGNGEVHDPMKLIIKGNYAYYLKELEYLRYLMKRNKNELEAKLALSDLKAMQKYYYDCFDPNETQCYSFKYPVDENIQDRYCSQLDNPYAEGQIRAFIRSGLNMQPFIPGSSLKGAMRTAILSHYVTEMPNYNIRRADEEDRRLQADTMMYRGRYGPDITSDPFKAIKISDANWGNAWMDIKSITVTNPPAARRPDMRVPARTQIPQNQNLPIIMELGKTGKGLETKSELNISITDSNLPGIRKLFPSGNYDMSAIVSMINAYSKTQLIKEKQIFNRMGESAVENFDILMSWFSAIKTNECMLRIGMGSGQRFFSYEVMDHNPKSRKMLGGIPLGWLKITFEEK